MSRSHLIRQTEAALAAAHKELEQLLAEIEGYERQLDELVGGGERCGEGDSG